MIGAQLQRAIYLALSQAGIVGDRVYDQVKGEMVFPYITIGDDQVIDDGNTCSDGWEVNTDIHVWSRPTTGSKAEVKTIMAAVHAAVTGIVTLENFTLISIQLETARTIRESDGLTEHGVMTFRALVDPA